MREQSPTRAISCEYLTRMTRDWTVYYIEPVAYYNPALRIVLKSNIPLFRIYLFIY